MTDDAPALRGTGIEQSFGDVVVLSGVDLTVDRTEIAALVGPNGSGKSTLLRILAGLDPSTEGTVDIPARSGRSRRLGFLPQQPAFRSGFTARDTIDFYASFVDGIGQDAVTRTLNRVGLDSVADRAVGSLSGGMTRLLGLGQALLGDPAVLLLDEPGSGLDPAMVERLFGILSDLAAEGTGIVVASHQLSAVDTYADTVSVLDGGRFVAEGSPAALRARTDTESLPAAFRQLVRATAGESTVRSGIDRENRTAAASDREGKER